MFFDTRRLHELRADSTESQVALLNAVFFLEEEEDNSNGVVLTLQREHTIANAGSVSRQQLTPQQLGRVQWV